MKISVVGGGYVGLVSAACFAELGHSVEIVEIDERKVRLINSGRPPIYERGLEDLLARNIGRRLAATPIYEGVAESDLTIICVGTPPLPDGNADLAVVTSAAESIGSSLRRRSARHVVVVKSTVPPGTTERLVAPAVMRSSGLGPEDVGFVMNPEFLREGVAIEDFMKPDRIVIGASDPMAGDLVESVYERLNAPVVRTGLAAAEMIKYASNALLATKISFSNEVGNICKKIGVDVYEVMRGVGMDHRISPHFLDAGAGFGGSCFPKDVAALAHLAEELGEDPALLRSVMEVNRRQPLKMADLLENKIGSLAGKRIAVLGLAFKKDTDDVRESRSLPLILELQRRGAKVAAYDPLAVPVMRDIVPGIEYCRSAEEALRLADGCLVMTEWDEFKNLDDEFDLMNSRVVIEGRRVLSCNGREGICW